MESVQKLTVVCNVQSHLRSSLDEAEAGQLSHGQLSHGQLSHGHSLATAQSEGLATASSRSLGSQLHPHPAKQASSRRSLDSKGGSRCATWLTSCRVAARTGGVSAAALFCMAR